MLVTLGLGALCSFVAQELTAELAIIDWVTVYASYVVVRLIASGVVRFRRSRKARSRTSL
jgi:hypothetical protein